MKRMIGALKAKLSRPKALDVPDQPNTTVSVKEVLMPDIYGDEDVGTVPDLKIPDQPSLEVGESAGFNPYDTGTLQKK
jgi:hypothetical protein